MLSAAISLAFTPYSRPTSCGEGATCCEEAFLPPFGDMSAGLGRDRRIGRSCESGAWEAILSAAISPAFWPYTRPASWGKLGPKGDEFRCAASAGANGEEAGGVLMASISNEESVEKNTGSAAISRGDHEVSRSETRLSAIRLSSHAPRKSRCCFLNLSKEARNTKLCFSQSVISRSRPALTPPETML